MSVWKPYKPWKIYDYIPPQLRQRLREMFVYIEATGTKQENQSPSADQNYRYPAPLNRSRDIHVPSSAKKEDYYNIQFYTRDSRRIPDEELLEIHPSLGLKEPLALPRGGSKGNKNPAVLAYDPTGTRSAMSTSWAETNKLLSKAASTHNVRMAWEDDADAILKDCQDKNIPPVPGRPFTWKYPKQAKECKW